MPSSESSYFTITIFEGLALADQSVIKQAMIMAAGLGTRLRPHTLHTPKPFLKVLGVPILQWVVDWLGAFGINEAVVNVHHLPIVTKTLLNEIEWGKIKWSISDETDLLLGSAGGIRKAQRLFSPDPIVVVNADVIAWLDLDALRKRHGDASEKVMTLALVEPKSGNAQAYREIQLNAAFTKVVGVGEMEVGKPFFSGVSIMNPEALQSVPLNRPTDFRDTLLIPWVQAKRVAAHVDSGLWFDIGTESLWKESESTLLRLSQGNQLPEVWKNRLSII